MSKLREILLKMFQGHGCDDEYVMRWLPDEVLAEAITAIQTEIRECCGKEKKMINEYKDFAGVHYAEVKFQNHSRASIMLRLVEKGLIV